MVDTYCDPTPIDYVIPANDDATKSIAYIMDALCGAIKEGLDERKLEKETPEQTEEKPAAFICISFAVLQKIIRFVR